MGGKSSRECLLAPEKADSGPGGLMSWFYTARLAGPAGEVKEMWISSATCPAPLPAAPERSGISQPSDVNKALVLTKPPGSTIYLGGPPCGWANPEV